MIAEQAPCYLRQAESNGVEVCSVPLQQKNSA